MVNRPGSAVDWARGFVGPALADGSLAVDATAGNGMDTVFMAGMVGDKGHVYAFDIQAEACQTTLLSLKKEGLEHRATLINDGHQHVESYIKGPIDAAMFNLGYLPGGNKQIVTGPETTLAAVRAALNMLSPRGRVSVVVYTGHPGSEQEAAALAEMAGALDKKEFIVLSLTYFNGQINAPRLYFFSRAGEAIERVPAEKNC